MIEPTGMINLPEEVWDKLRELQQELDEGSYALCFYKILNK